jgi:hypothetical protein
MGGLLVRQVSGSSTGEWSHIDWLMKALLLANNERGILGSLREAICAILFLGTPHGRSMSDDYETVLSRMADAIIFPTPAEKLVESFRTVLLESLRNIAESLLPLADQFSEFADGIHVSLFVEKSPLPDMQYVVSVFQILYMFSSANIVQLVDDYSGRAWVSNERLIPMLDHDHRQICKHSSFTSQGIGKILSELRDITQRKSAALASSWAAAQIIEPQDGSAVTRTAASLRSDALLRAAATGSVSAVERLIKQGADCNTRNSQGETALLLACQHSYANIGLRLLEEGADANECDVQGNSPLHFASGRGDTELVLTILERGGNPNLIDKTGATPLHQAAECGNAATVKCLLDHGANWPIRNILEELPAGIARKNHQLEAMKLLHRHAQNVDQESNEYLCHLSNIDLCYRLL